MVGTSRILHRAQPKGEDKMYKKGEAKRDYYHGAFGVNLFLCLGNVCLIKDLSAWVVTEL